MLNQKVKSVLGGTIACQSNNTSIRRELSVEDHGYQFSPTHKRYLQKKHQQICRFNRYANNSRKEKSYPTPTPLHMDCKMLACCPCNHNPGNSPHHRYVRPPGDACLISRSCLPCSRSTVGVALSASPLRRAYEYHVLKQSFWAEVG